MAFWPVVALAAACAQAPTGEEIARNLSARAAQDEASSFSAKYRKEWVEEDLIDPEQPRIAKNKVWHIEGNGARFVQTLVEDSTHNQPVGHQKVKVSDARHMFVARYRFTVELPCLVTMGERKLWVVAFSPRSNVTLPEGEEEDLFLNRMSGTMYIDAESWYVRNAIGKLIEPFPIQIIGKIIDAQAYLDQDDVDGVVLLRHIAIELWAERHIGPFFRKQYHLRQIYQFFRQPTETTPSISPLP